MKMRYVGMRMNSILNYGTYMYYALVHTKMTTFYNHKLLKQGESLCEEYIAQHKVSHKDTLRVKPTKT